MKILIIKPSSFGDIVHGLQVAQSIKDQLPEAEIAWVVRDIFESLVSNCAAVDDVFIFRRNEGVWAFLKLIREIRKERYDWVLDFQGLARSGLLTLAARGRNKAVRSDARELSGLGFWKRAPLPPEGKQAHALVILLQFLKLLGLEPEVKKPVQFLFDSGKVKFQPEVIKDDQFLILFPNSRRREKEWRGFSDLTDLILKSDLSYRVIWLGQAPIPSQPEWPKERFFNLIGRTTIAEVIYLVNKASFVVSNDSGPLHLAAALQKPLIALFGPTDSRLYGPYPLDSETNHVITFSDFGLLKKEVSTVFESLKERLV